MVTKSNGGGAQKYLYDLARSLPRSDFDIAVAAGGHGALFEKCEELHIRTLRIPHLDRDISFFKEFKAFFALYKLLKSEKPNIIHLNSPKMGALGTLAGRLSGIKNIIYTSHGWTFNEDRPWWQRMIIKIFSWIIVMLSTQTIAISETEKKQVEHWPFIKNKIVVVPLGIETPAFLEKSEARKKLFELAHVPDQGNEVILSIGELTKNKGYIYALEALKDHSKPYAYFIAGTGELKDTLEKYISEEKTLHSQVHLLGFVPDAAQYMRGADVFLLPSVKEGLPYVLLEAGFAEVPVIATDVGGISTLAGNDASKLIPAKTPRAIL